MAVNGIVNAEVLISSFDEPGTMYSESNFEVISLPINANASITEIQNGDITEIYLNADVVGDYEVQHNWHQDAQQGGDEDNGIEIIYITLTDAIIDGITQTHENVGQGASNCDEHSVKVTGSEEFNEINGVAVTSALEHVITKPRDANLLITIIATNPTYGESSLMNTSRVALMPTITAEVTNMDVVMKKPDGNSALIDYDFGDGAGYSSVSEHHYTTEGYKVILARDFYGCVQTLQVYVEELVPIDLHDYPSELYVSKANPIRFALREAIGLCGNYINDENSFGCEDQFSGIKYEDIQRVRRCWNVTNQFKSGFDTHQVHIYNSETHEVVGSALPITEKVTNIGYTDSRNYLHYDDSIYSFLYFDEFEMIPPFYEIGGIVTIGTETQTILNILYLESEDIWAIKTLKFTYTSSLLEYTYNRENKNIYEFILESQTLGNGRYYMEITAERTTATDPLENKTVTYRSNTFETDYEFERTVDIIYWNETNNDIYWQSGIKGVLTVGLDYRLAVNDHVLEVVKTDNLSYLKKAFGVEKFEFLFEPLTLEIAVKLKYALSQYNVAINGVLYSFEDIEMETIDNDTNDYIIKAIGIKSNKNINFISNLKRFDWSSGSVKWDSSIPFDSTVTTI